jgi:hypothetical protein
MLPFFEAGFIKYIGMQVPVQNMVGNETKNIQHCRIVETSSMNMANQIEEERATLLLMHETTQLGHFLIAFPWQKMMIEQKIRTLTPQIEHIPQLLILPNGFMAQFTQ